MFNWLDKKILDTPKLSTRSSSSRWAYIQIFQNVGFFAISVSIAFLALAFSLQTAGVCLVAILVFVLAALAFVVGLYFAAYSTHLAKKWFDAGSKDITASSKDITDAEQRINVQITELVGAIDRQSEAIQANTKAVSDLVGEIKADRAERKRHKPREDGNLERK